MVSYWGNYCFYNCSNFGSLYYLSFCCGQSVKNKYFCDSRNRNNWRDFMGSCRDDFVHSLYQHCKINCGSNSEFKNLIVAFKRWKSQRKAIIIQSKEVLLIAKPTPYGTITDLEKQPKDNQNYWYTNLPFPILGALYCVA